jgi:hypothetical protein
MFPVRYELGSYITEGGVLISSLLQIYLRLPFSFSCYKLYKNKLPGFQSASELYRLSDRHLSAKFSVSSCG